MYRPEAASFRGRLRDSDFDCIRSEKDVQAGASGRGRSLFDNRAGFIIEHNRITSRQHQTRVQLFQPGVKYVHAFPAARQLAVNERGGTRRSLLKALPVTAEARTKIEITKLAIQLAQPPGADGQKRAHCTCGALPGIVHTLRATGDSSMQKSGGALNSLFV
jgi:hypothetical protein